MYGSAFAFPQVARSSGYQGVYVSLWIRAYLGLALNYVVQFALVMFVGEATQIMNPLGGMMHLCDFGAELDDCKGPEAPFQPRCTGPGGTQFSPSRLYSYTQWAVQKFAKQALLDVLPDQEDLINEKVDPGEYGLENRSCRWLCLLLFALSVNHEIQVCFRMTAMLWYLPSEPDKCDWIEIDKKRQTSYRIAGMPIHWKIITGLIVLIPKVTLCYFVLLEGTTLLMDTSGILDTVLGAMSMAFILDVDEMLHDCMITRAGRSLMQKIQALREEPQGEDVEGPRYHGKGPSFLDLFRQVVPTRLLVTLLCLAVMIDRYYQFKCVYKEELGMWVSKPMHVPGRASRWALWGQVLFSLILGF